jgi:hypothetical protein
MTGDLPRRKENVWDDYTTEPKAAVAPIPAGQFELDGTSCVPVAI